MRKARIERDYRWNKAIAEGRVVRYNDGDFFNEFPTPKQAKLAVELATRNGWKAEIVDPKPAKK